MYAHGYVPASAPPAIQDDPQKKGLRDVYLSRGFAFAESAYSTQGWAVKEGIEDTEALRRYFVGEYGKPSEAYITGHSMGGHITLAIIERYPEAYDGALPLCGPLTPASEFFNQGLLDLLVTFEYFFPGTIGSPYEPSLETAARVRAALAAAPEKATAFARRVQRSTEQLPMVLGFYQLIATELKQRAGGDPLDNTNRIYTGYGDDVALNRGVKRYSADPAGREYVKQYYSPTGHISDPVFTLHTTGDQLVLASDVTPYEVQATLAGTQDLFVARYVVAAGHCNFTPEQQGRAFDELLRWAREGKRPAAGEQK